MKKRKKIILWIAVIVLVLCSITALSIKPDIDASGKDLFLYRMSGFSLFLIWLFGLIIELDVFHIKKNILLVKRDRISLHIIFWIILIILSLIVFGVFYNFTSQDYHLYANTSSKAAISGLTFFLSNPRYFAATVTTVSFFST